MPSGLTVTLFDVILEIESQIARFRFETPQIGEGGKSFGDVVEDFEYLCAAVVVPSLAANDWEGTRVVISLSAEELPFGTTAPEVTQYFQPFEVVEGECQWLDF